MCRHQVVARIFLFIFIVYFTFAGLTQIAMVHDEEIPGDSVSGTAEDVTEASERGHTQPEELPQWSGRPASKAWDLHPRVDPVEPQLINAGDPEKDKFFNEEVIRKMKEYLVLGSIYGVFVGISNGMQKEIMGTVSPNAYVFASFLPPPLANILNGASSQTYSDYGVSQSNGWSLR